MYNKRFNYVLVGTFVLSMLLAAVVAVAVLTGRTGPSDRYVVRLDNVTDIKYGTQVRFEGFPIGQIERIEAAAPDAPARFRIEISVARDWAIPADSLVRIGSSSFLAAKTLDIESGGSPVRLTPGSEIAGAAPADMFTAMQAAASGLSALSEGSVKPLLATLHALIGTVNRDTPRITGELASFAENLNASLEPVQSILSEDNVRAIGRTIAKTERTAQTLHGAGQDLAVAMDRLESITGNLDTLVEANDATVEQTLQDLQHTLATVARSVDTIVHNFDNTARHMNEFSRLIRNNPGVLLGGTPRAAVSEARAPERRVGRGADRETGAPGSLQ